MKCDFLFSLARKYAFVPLLIAVLLAVGSPDVGYAQNDLKEIPVPDPVAELAAMKLDPAIEVNLFASDPMVSKPIHSNFAHDGKLWVATSSIYPQLSPGEVADDKIIVLEDTDHDGTADKSTVFADGLLIPTGVLPDLPNNKGVGCYVAASTQLLYFLDTDGDGRSDQRRVVLSGFGTEDTHHLLHTLRWGPDGCLYMNQSIYIHSHVETPYGTQNLDGGGIWRFNPRSMKLDIVCKGFVNPWGHVFDADGQSFATDGAYNEGINHVFPGSVFVTSPGEERWLAGMNPGSPKHCGLEILHDHSIPASYFNHMISSDFRAHRVNRFEVVKTEQSYRSIQQSDLIRSEHPAFRPIDTKLGPDGCLYISDWYNPIIQHGEVDFRDDRRDRTHGRIWRIRWKDSKATARTYSKSVDKQSIDELMISLVETNYTQASWAKLELARRDKVEVNKLLDAKVKSAEGTTEANPWLRLRCEIEAHRDTIRPESIAALLESKNPNDRASGIRFYSDFVASSNAGTPANVASAIAVFSKGIHDADWLVRLEALAALRKVNTVESIAAAIAVTDLSMTPELDFALWKLLREDEAKTIEMLAKEQSRYKNEIDETTLKRWKVVVQSLKNSDWAASMGDNVLAGRVPLTVASNTSFEMLELISSRVDEKKAGQLLDWVAEKFLTTSETNNDKFSSALKALEAVRSGSEKSKITPANASATLPKFLAAYQKETGDETTRATYISTLARAAGQWSVGSMKSWLDTTLNDDSILKNGGANGSELLGTIVESLGAMGGSQSIKELAAIAKDTKRPQSVRAAAVTVMAKSNLKEAAKACVESLGSSDDGVLFGFVSIVSRKNGPEAMLGALGNATELSRPTALAALSAMQANGIARDDLRTKIKTLGKVDSHAWKYSPELLADIQKRLETSADPARGEAIYRQASLQCVRCHAIGSGGGNIGPNLQSLGGSSQVDYILQSLIEPDAKLKEGFQTTIVMTDEDQIITGLIKSRSAEQLKLLTGEGKMVDIAIDDIAEEKEGKSLMPAGLVDALPIEDLADMVAFMSQLGRTQAYSVSTEPWIRNWQFIADTPAGQKLLNRTSVDSVATDDSALTWENVASLVNGKLPIHELHAMKPHRDVDPFVTIRVNLDCQQPGSIQLKLSDAVEGHVQAWFDSERWPEPTKIARNCSSGPHRLVLTVTRSRVKELGIQIEGVAINGTASAIVVPVAVHQNIGFDSRTLATHLKQKPGKVAARFRFVSTESTSEQSSASKKATSSVGGDEWFQSKDRVAWLGGRSWEQMSEKSDLELLLTTRRPDLQLTFRNVSWSGDDVEGRARVAFGKIEDGYQRRLTDLKAAKPNVVFVAYGHSEAIDSRWTSDRFEKGVQRLINDLLAAGYKPVVVLPPALPTNVSFPIDVATINNRINEFRSILDKQAKVAGVKTVLHPEVTSEMTDDGLAIHEKGYRLLAVKWADILMPESKSSRLPTAISVDVKNSTTEINNAAGWGIHLSELKDNQYSLNETFTIVPSNALSIVDQPIKWKIKGLVDSSSYQLLLDGKLVASGTGKEWSAGLDVNASGATIDQQSIQKKIIEKEQAFFHQYRPQNETYLFLFRKHEQGRNAVDTEKFAKQAEAIEKDIQELLKSKSHSWSLVKQ